MIRDEKIEFHRQVAEIERAVRQMNGPFVETGQILSMLGTLREAWIDDVIFAGCEACSEPILESESETASSSEDGSWFCHRCVARWKAEQAPQVEGAS